MSVDFSCYAEILDAASAEREYCLLGSRQWLGDIIGPDEQTLFRFGRDGERPDLKAIAEIYDGELAPLCLEAPVVNLTMDDLALLDQEGRRAVPMHEPARSPNFPSLVVIDQAIAIPHGISFLEGTALRRFGVSEIPGLKARWLDLVQRAGGIRGLVDRVAPYLDRGGNGLDDAFEAVELVEWGIETAGETQLDLLLYCTNLP